MLSEVCLSGEIVCCQKSVRPVRLCGFRRVFVRCECVLSEECSSGEVVCCQKSVRLVRLCAVRSVFVR